MPSPRPLHPWVAARRDRMHFAVQLNAELNKPPGRSAVNAAPLAEDLGFDAIFQSDHPTWAPDPYIQLTAMAMKTKRVWLGPMVAAEPYRNPVVYARLLSDLDSLSDGRAINGLGIGWDASEWEMGINEFERLDIPYLPARDRQAALEETLAIMRGAWSPEPFSFEGQYRKATGVMVPPLYSARNRRS